MLLSIFVCLQVKALWPKTTDPFMHIIVQGYTSKTFQYRASSNKKDEIVENVLLKMGQDVSKIIKIRYSTVHVAACHIS